MTTTIPDKEITPTVQVTTPSRLIAVIDIGASSIRMAIAQVSEDGHAHTLESLCLPVSLGKDTFTKGGISLESTEECVQALHSFRRVLDEYQVSDVDNIRAIATSAVREANNREAFLDRLYIATGFDVNVIDEEETNQYLYLGIKPFLNDQRLKEGQTLVIEVGAGSTEILVLHDEEVVYSNTYRLGSLRVRQILEEFRSSPVQLHRLMKTHIERIVSEIVRSAHVPKTTQILMIGGDARFAATHLLPKWDQSSLVELDIADLEKLLDRISTLSVDELARNFHISYPDAETLCPALLSNTRLANLLNLKKIFVTGTSIRDGLVAELVAHSARTDDFSRQIINSALELGRKYRFDRNFSENVASLSRAMFRVLQDEHKLSPRYELILTLASLLTEIGKFISYSGHHKHAMYLINNSDIFGLGPRDKALVAMVARYHRKASPSMFHEEYAALSREDRIVVCKLSAILRTAVALEGGHMHDPKNFQFALEPGKLVVRIARLSDFSMEQLGLQRKGQLFEQVFGRTVAIRPASGDHS